MKQLGWQVKDREVISISIASITTNGKGFQNFRLLCTRTMYISASRASVGLSSENRVRAATIWRVPSAVAHLGVYEPYRAKRSSIEMAL